MSHMPSHCTVKGSMYLCDCLVSMWVVLLSQSGSSVSCMRWPVVISQCAESGVVKVLL